MVPQQKPDRRDSPWYNSIFMKLKTSPVMCSDRVPSVAVWHWDQVNHWLPEAQTSFGVVEVFCLDLGSGLSTIVFVKPHHTERLKVGRLYSCWTSDPSPSHTVQHESHPPAMNTVWVSHAQLCRAHIRAATTWPPKQRASSIPSTTVSSLVLLMSHALCNSRDGHVTPRQWGWL